MTPGRPSAAVDAMIELMEQRLRELRPDRGGRTLDDYRREAARRRRPAIDDVREDTTEGSQP